MKIQYLTLSIALVAGLVCLGAFITRIVKGEAPDYTILMAGMLIIGLGAAAWFRRK